MKIKTLILAAALIGTAALSAQAGVRFGFSFNVPAPIVVTTPAYPPPAFMVATPTCPGPGYIWAPGYWSVSYGGRVWVPGCWRYHPGRAFYDYGRSYGFDRDYDRGHDHDWHHW